MNSFWNGFEKRAGSLGTKKVVRAWERATKAYRGGDLGKYNRLEGVAMAKADKSRLKDIVRKEMNPDKDWPKNFAKFE
jgi:hypothetical protein